MSQKSLEFVLFAAGVILVYYALQKTKLQKYFLLVVSLFFMWKMTNLQNTLLVTGLAAAVFGIAGKIQKQKEQNRDRAAKGWFLLGTFLDIGMLLYFKFFTGTYELLQTWLTGGGISLPDLIAPIGLSYFSLALYGYLYDIYHGKYEAEGSFLLFLCYVTYFPAIIEGPVNLYRKLMPQLKEAHTFDEARLWMGLQRCLWGYFKTLVIADRIGILVMGILQDETAVGPLIFYAMVLYSFQIYSDFSGGIDIIMGISEALGISLTENFRSPLISKSVVEYWQRWHMSLGDFMEKYLYYPIVLNRNVMKFSKKIPNKHLKRAFSATLASFIVFVLVGIWHGTGWNYVVYGLYQAIFVSSAVLLAPTYHKLKTALKIDDKTIGWRVFTILRTFVILVFGRMLIRSADLSQAFVLLKRMFSSTNPHALFDGSLYNYGLDHRNLYLVYICMVLIILVDILHEKGVHFRLRLMRQGIVVRYLIYYAVLFSIIIVGIYGAQYNAADFIYQGF